MNKEQVISAIREFMARQFGITPAFVASDANFENLGLDLLDRYEICEELEEKYGVVLGNEECFESNTVGELAETVVSLLKATQKGK